MGVEALTLFCEFLRQQAAWLSGAPAGIKLHRPFAEFYAFCLSQVATIGLKFHQALLSVFQPVWMPIMFASAAFGISMMLAVLSDLVFIAAIPILLLYTGTTWLLTSIPTKITGVQASL